MMDDPAFVIDMPPPPLDFDFANMDLNPKGYSQRSSQSMLSVRGRSGSIVSQASSVLGFNIPSSNGGSYQLPMHDPFSDSSAQKPFGAGPSIFNDDEDMILQDDELFDFDADGQLRDIPASERDARRAASINPQRQIGSDAAASGRVRKEHETAFVGRIQGVDGDGDFDMPFYGDDDLPVFPDAEPFPLMTGGLGGSDRPLHMSDEDRVFSASESSVSAEAPQRPKKKAKKLVVDSRSEISNIALSQHIKDYHQNMAVNFRVKAKQYSNTQATKNAYYFVYGSGINGIGDGIGAAKIASPLAMFSGEALMAKITGKPIPEPKSMKRAKRAFETDEQDEEETPNKRAREDEVGRGNHDDEMIFNLDEEQEPRQHDQSVEMGRDAASALADHPPFAMPWNISSSLHSHQRGSSVQGRIGILGSQIGSVTGRRLTSPLVGRGSALPGDLEQFSQLMDDDMVMYGRDDDGFGSTSQASGFHPGGLRSSSQAIGRDDFEIFGAAAGVDTQTAGSSQWMKDVMDRESNNFFDYVKNTIDEKSGDELGDEDEAKAEAQQKTVTFEELFVPENNSCIVAAQAFYHILSLATTRKVWVEQDVDEEMLIPFGEIRIGVV